MESAARGWFFAVPMGLPRRLALAAILALAAGLNLYRFGQDGWANAYYVAGVRSMLTSWSNFFFVSLDKPPLGFWVQALSAKVLGFRPCSLLLPQALAGIGTYLVLPALWLCYLIAAPRSLRVRLGHLAVATCTIVQGPNRKWPGIDAPTAGAATIAPAAGALVTIERSA